MPFNLSILARLPATVFGALATCASLPCMMATAADHALLGQTPKQYQVQAGWGDVSSHMIALQNCHAMRQDDQGRIVMINTGPKNNVIIFSADGKVAETWGSTYPGAHGLAFVTDSDGACLWLTDHDRHQVIKTTIKGVELKVIDWPKDVAPYAKADQYKPTDIEFADDGSFFVFDGYGLAYVLHYKADGTLIKTFGGKGKEPHHLNTPHGGAIDRKDPTRPLVVVASRGDQAIKRYLLDGTYVDTIPMPGAAVCDVMIQGDYIYVPNLNGYLSILDRNYRVISNISGAPPVYDDKRTLQKMTRVGNTFIHPHNLYTDPAGAIYVAQWNSKGTHPIKLTPVK